MAIYEPRGMKGRRGCKGVDRVEPQWSALIFERDDISFEIEINMNFMQGNAFAIASMQSNERMMESRCSNRRVKYLEYLAFKY